MSIRNKVPIRICAVAIALALSAPALAADGFSVKAKQFNPDDVDATIVAARVKGAGNPDATVPEDHNHVGWVLARNNTLSPPGPEASADLTINFPGRVISVNRVGFDRLTGGTQCGGGSPRFNVEFAAGVLFLECDQPATALEGGYTITTTRTDLGNGWERVLFDISPAVSATFLQVLSDSGPGAALLDNIVVNDTVIGK